MSFAKLDGTNYRLWAMRMTDYLQPEGLWNLVNGREELLEKPEKEESDKDKLVKEYKKNMEKYEKHDLRMEKASGRLRMAMTDAIAIRSTTKWSGLQPQVSGLTRTPIIKRLLATT